MADPTPTSEPTSAPAPSTPAPAPSPAPTLASGGPSPDPAPAPAPTGFPANWREQLAAGDAQALKDLAKYTSPDAVYKSLRSVQADISSGKLKAPPAPLAADATDEQKTAWRAANSLPDKAEAYVEKLALPDGVVLGEADKPLIAEFGKMAFDKGWSQDQMNQAVSWWYEQQDVAEAARVEADGASRVQSEVALRTEWGPDFTQNMNAFGSLKAMMPTELQEMLFTARTGDGRMLGNTAEFVKWGAQLARELNPAAAIVPAGGDTGKTIDNEIASIDAVYQKAISGDQEARRAYYGHDGKPGLDARQRELIDAQQKMQARGKAA